MLKSRLGILLLTSLAASISGCLSNDVFSPMNYPSVKASAPPQALAGLWAGPHGGGRLFVELLAEGTLRSCLSAPPYYHQMDGKYSRQAFYFEDGSRVAVRLLNSAELVIDSPPGNPVATLTAHPDKVELAECFALAAHGHSGV